LAGIVRPNQILNQVCKIKIRSIPIAALQKLKAFANEIITFCVNQFDSLPKLGGDTTETPSAQSRTTLVFKSLEVQIAVGGTNNHILDTKWFNRARQPNH
jgi:hypothetical protein